MLNEVVLISCLLPSMIFSFPATSRLTYSPLTYRSLAYADSTEACIEECIIQGKDSMVCMSSHKTCLKHCTLLCNNFNENKNLTPTHDKSGDSKDGTANVEGKVIIKRSVPDDDSMVRFVNAVLEQSKERYSDDDQVIPNRFEYAIDNNEPGQIESSLRSNENIAEKVWTVLYALRKANKQLILARNAKKTVINELDNIAMNLLAMDKKNFYNGAAIDKIDEAQTTPMEASNNHVLRYGSNYEGTIVGESPETSPESVTTENDKVSIDRLENSGEMRQEKSFISTDNDDASLHQSSESDLSETEHNGRNNEDAHRDITEHETTEVISSENVESTDESNIINHDSVRISSENYETKEENNNYPIDEFATKASWTLSSSEFKENHVSQEHEDDETKDENEIETSNTPLSVVSVEEKLDETQEENNKDTNENSTEKAEAHSTESLLSDLDDINEKEAGNDDETNNHTATELNISNIRGNDETKEENNNDADSSNTDQSNASLLLSNADSESSETVLTNDKSNESTMDAAAVSDLDTSSTKNSGSVEAQADDSHSSEQTTVESEHSESSPSNVHSTTVSSNKFSEPNSNVSSETSNEAVVTIEPNTMDKDVKDITVEETDSTTITPEENSDANQSKNERSAETVPSLSTVDSSDMQSSNSKSVQEYSFEEPSSAPFLSIPLNNIFIPNPVPEEKFNVFSWYPKPVDTVYDGDDSMRVSNSYEYNR